MNNKRQVTRLPAEERRQQILEAVLQIVAEHGLVGVKMSRVAEIAGVGPGTIYRHFDNQDSLILAALDALRGKLYQLIELSQDHDALGQLRALTARHIKLLQADGRFAAAWIQFVAAGQQMGLQEAVAETQRELLGAIRALYERAKAQGALRPDADTGLLAYQHINIAWGADMCALMGLDEALRSGYPEMMLEQNLRSAAVT